MTSRLATPPELISLENDKYGYHLSKDVSKSWKTLQQCCYQIAAVLRALFEQDYPKMVLNCPVPPEPSDFGYYSAHSTEKKARSALSESQDAFVILFAYVSFCIAICRSSTDPLSVSSLSLTSTKPRWLQQLSARSSGIHPQYLQLLTDSPISDFTTTPQRLGTIINVSQCPWIQLVPRMLVTNVPIWLYWGIPPVFVQPLDHNALIFAPRSHPQTRAPPLPVITPSQTVGLPTPSQSASVQSASVPVRSAHGGSGQLPGETWKDFMIRQNSRRKNKLSKESDVQRQAREGRENTAAKKSCPGKKGPTVFIWEIEDGVWTRTVLTRGEVEDYWGNYRSTQKIYNSIDNCWDLCYEFDAGNMGQIDEYDSNDSDNDVYRPKKQSRRSPTPTPENRSSGDGSAFPPVVVDSASTPQSVLMPPQVFPDCTLMDVDSTRTPQISSDPPSMLVDPSDLAPQSIPTPALVTSDSPSMLVDPSDPAPQSVSTPAQVASDSPSMLVDPSDPAPQSVSMPAQVASDCSSMLVQVDSHDPAPLPPSIPLQNPNPQSDDDFIGSDDDDHVKDPYDATRQDVLNAYSFTLPELEPMPVTTLDDLLYYRYGFSPNESPYTGIPSSVTGTRSIRSKTEVRRAVGGQQLESSALEADPVILDFLSILAGSSDPFNDVPEKYWDLRPSGPNGVAFVDLDKVFISIEERQFEERPKYGNDGKHYIIRPRHLHPSRDTSESWLLSVDPMTALECVRRGLGPHTIDIANFLISHGVPFHTLQQIPNSPNSENPPARPCRYLGYRSVGYSFDLADFAGYEALRDSFLRAQSHGPLALRQGGIIARLAREVLPDSNALSGPSSEALSGHRARFIYGDEIYVDDHFSDVELRLICGTYALGIPKHGGNDFSFF
jgi:hypothetical protein